MKAKVIHCICFNFIEQLTIAILRNEFPVSVFINTYTEIHVIGRLNQLTGKLSNNTVWCHCTVGFVI